MISTLLLAALGGLTFVEQEIPGLSIGEPRFFSGEAETNFRHVDLNADGLMDLVLPKAIYLQEDGRFCTETPVAWPEFEERPRCDVWERDFYLRFDKELRVLRWSDNAWTEALRQPIQWPAPAQMPEFKLPEGEKPRPGVDLERFLHDLDGDGWPEIVIPNDDGVHVFYRAKEAAEPGAVPPFAGSTRLDVLPPLWPVVLGANPLLTPARRSAVPVLPTMKTSCELFFDGPAVTVVSYERTGAAQARFATTRHVLDPANRFAVLPEQTTTRVSAPLPRDVGAVRLNGDDALDFIGVHAELSELSVVPTGVVSIWASVDGGKTGQLVKTHVFDQRNFAVDFDSDGNQDLVAESSGLFEGGIREIVNRALTARTVSHELRIHLQNAAGIFSKNPDIRQRFVLHLDKPILGPNGIRNLPEGVLDVSGDFNGDGFHDVVIQDYPNRVSLHLYDGRRFQKMAEVTLPIGPDERFSVADVDGDGRSDVAVQRTAWEGDTRVTHTRVYFSREAGP